MKFLSMIVLFIFSALFSQDSLEGIPYSFNNNIGNYIGFLETEEVNHDQMLLEDDLRPKNSPYRYGKKFEINHNFFTYAEKEVLTGMPVSQSHSFKGLGP